MLPNVQGGFVSAETARGDFEENVLGTESVIGWAGCAMGPFQSRRATCEKGKRIMS
jgi:hypothetical protein